MTITCVTIATKKFVFGIYECPAVSDVGTGDFSPELGILHVCGHAHVRSHESPGMDCCTAAFILIYSML